MFLEQWDAVRNSSDDLSKYRPTLSVPSDGYVQPYCDSPLDDEYLGENVYLNMINGAKRYVYITTPYLIVDSEMKTALCLAAKRGVDVQIITPGIPDKKIVWEEVSNNGTLRVAVYKLLIFILKYIAPIGIALIFINELGFLK